MPATFCVHFLGGGGWTCKQCPGSRCQKAP